MKRLRSLLAPALWFASACTMAAGPVKSEDQAIQLVVAAVHRFELTTLSDECWLMGVTEQPARFDFAIKERHTPTCGGDPATQPRLFTVRVRKRDGQMTGDVYGGTVFRPLNRKLTRP